MNEKIILCVLCFYIYSKFLHKYLVYLLKILRNGIKSIGKPRFTWAKANRSVKLGNDLGFKLEAAILISILVKLWQY